MPATDSQLLAASSPGAFALLADHRHRLPAHLKLLDDKLVAFARAVERGESPRLKVFMPPRHGKSEAVSRYFPAWLLGTHPAWRVILCSYEATFAQSWGRKARDLLEEHGRAWFGTGVSDKSASASWWETDRGGAMLTAGVGGPITGKGADVAVIDDPIKNAEEALSETIRRKHKDWFNSTLYTRLQPGGGIIVLQTRWHEDDLGGWLGSEETGGDAWEQIVLPALAEDDDPLGRAPGEPLWPAQFPVEALARIREQVGPYYWSALYQQRPTPAEGDVFQRSWFGVWDAERPWSDQFEAHRLAQSWDCTFKDTDGSDFVVGQLWACDLSRRILVAQIRARLSLDGTITAARAMSAFARERFPKVATHSVYVEDKANGPAVIAALKRELQGVTAVEPEGGKLARAYGVQPIAAAGDVVLPGRAIPCPGAPKGQGGRPLWLPSTRGDLIEEAAAFPNGVHDDQVDAMTQALGRLTSAATQHRVRGGGYDAGVYADR